MMAQTPKLGRGIRPHKDTQEFQDFHRQRAERAIAQMSLKERAKLFQKYCPNCYLLKRDHRCLQMVPL